MHCLSLSLFLPAAALYAQDGNQDRTQDRIQDRTQDGEQSPDSLGQFLQDIFHVRNQRQSEEELRDYPKPPLAGSFGYKFNDDYAIDPSERPISKNPALPLSPEEKELQQRYREEQAKILRKQDRRDKNRFNREFRFGLAFDAYIGINNFLNIGDLESAQSVPTPYVFSQSITDATPGRKTIPIFNNYYEVSAILHLTQNLEISLGLGYQTDAFLSPLKTIGAERQYGEIERQAPYAIQYQRDLVFYEMGMALLLPWVLNSRAKTVLGLRLAGSLALGLITGESLRLAQPSLPSSITDTDADPTPRYSVQESFNTISNQLNTKFTTSLGVYFEMTGFRVYLGYSLRFFPSVLYPDVTYHILQDFQPDDPIRYSSIAFPEIQLLHALNISIQYFLNPLELLGKRSIYSEVRRKRRRFSGATLQESIG